MLYFAAFVLGSIWGSFSNVCIYRLPKNGNIVKSRSYCTSCKKKINWYDNIPLISYLLLGGRCRNCKKKINFQYFLVELISAASFTIIYFIYGISVTTLLLFILSTFFLIIFFIDLKHYIIPNELTYPLMVIGFLKSFDPNLNQILFPNYINSLLGGFFGYVIIWLIIFVYKKVRNKEGMGLGDAKLLAVVGFWFGWISIPFTIFVSSFVALVLVIPSLINKILNGDNPVKIWGDGSSIRDFIYSKDVAYGIILALINGKNSNYYNLGSGEGISIKKLVETLNQIIDFKYEYDISKPSGAPKRIMDISKAKKELKFFPQTNLKTGLQETIDWYKNNKSDHLKKQNYFTND